MGILFPIFFLLPRVFFFATFLTLVPFIFLSRLGKRCFFFFSRIRNSECAFARDFPTVIKGHAFVFALIVWGDFLDFQADHITSLKHVTKPALVSDNLSIEKPINVGLWLSLTHAVQDNSLANMSFQVL